MVLATHDSGNGGGWEREGGGACFFHEFSEDLPSTADNLSRYNS